MIISTHTLTWSVTGMGFWRSLLKIHFNSHAHVERDEIVRNWINAQSISTHTLTWSVTGIISSSYLLIYAFQLTRSRGAWLQNCNYLLWQYHFNSHAHVERDAKPKQNIVKKGIFQLTRSRGAWLLVLEGFSMFLHFNSHAHVERDQWALLAWPNFSISTHTLTWSVTRNALHLTSWILFQLTRSRGAWHIY